MEAERAEFTNLKVQLKIIEVQAQTYMPHDQNDEQLTAGIQRWKLEWGDASRRARTRRNRRKELRQFHHELENGSLENSAVDEDSLLDNESVF
jgi:hypothetical protein